MLPRHSLLLSHAPHSTSCHRLPLFVSPTIPTTSIFPRKALSENSSRLRNFRKYCTELLFACGTSARITQNCILFAELPQILHKSAFCLRNFRKYCAKTYLTCGTSAMITQNCIIFAGEPQILNKNVSYLRKFRKYCTKMHLACGTSANSMQFKNTPYYIITPFAR